MTLRLTAAVMMTAGMLSACDGGATQDKAPQVPGILVWHDEPPIGSALNHRLVRATRAAANRLEPQFGPLQPRIYTVSNDDLPRLAGAMRSAMPEGWHELEVTGQSAREGDLIAYANGGKLFAALVIAPDGAGINPVVLLRNQALLDADRPGR